MTSFDVRGQHVGSLIRTCHIVQETANNLEPRPDHDAQERIVSLPLFAA